jgi:signal transduction histidine kinase
MVKVISQDPALHELCREIHGGHAETAIATAEPDGDRAADLYVLDFEPGTAIPPAVLRNPRQHLFLVDPANLPILQTSLARSDANILLKPFAQTILAAFLGLAPCPNPDPVDGSRADLDEMLQCLIQTSLRLQDFDQDRTNFLARALHDFAPPLTAIGGYCDLLVNEVLGPLKEEQKEVLRKMSRSTRRLTQMACAMYELSVGRHVPLPVDRREGSIEDCIDLALHEAEVLASAKGISIVPSVDPPLGLLVFNSALIEQVLFSLLENACKFSTKAGTVELRAYPYFWERRRAADAAAPLTGDRRRSVSFQPNAYRIDILNEGPPLPGEHLHHLFEEYTSYSGGQDRSGGGLGLAVSRMHIDRHDGHIWAENRESGPAFSFVLPVKTMKATISGARTSEDNCGHESAGEQSRSVGRRRARGS